MSLFPKKGGRGQNGKKGGRHQKGKLPNKKKPYPGNWKEVLKKKNELGWLQQIKAKSIRKKKIMEEKYSQAKLIRSTEDFLILASQLLQAHAHRRPIYQRSQLYEDLQDKPSFYNNKDKPTDPSEVEETVNWWIPHVQLVGCKIEHAPDWIKQNREVAEKSIQRNPYSLRYLKSFWSDLEMVSMAVSIEPSTLDYLPRYWRDNPHVMKLAFQRSMMAYKYLGEPLKKLPGFERLLKCEDKYGLGSGDFRLNLLDQEVSHELMKHDRFLLFLAGTRNQSLLISKLGGHSGLLKRKVSEFLGVPTGQLLWALRTAKKHIEAGLEREKYYKDLQRN